MSTTPEFRPNATPEPAEPAPGSPGVRPSPQALPSDLPPPDPAPAPVQTRPFGAAVPRTRTSAAWFGVWAGVVVLILLIIFVAQNTGNVEVTFLWMHGSLPLALALLISGVGGAVIAMGVAAARIGQLRRLLRRRR